LIIKADIKYMVMKLR